jgi:hypothetical protein
MTMTQTQTPPVPEPQPELPGKEASPSLRERLNSIGSGGFRSKAADNGSLVDEGYPNINLVSPSIIEAQGARRLRRKFVYALLLLFVVIAGGWFVANQMNSGRASDLTAASSTLNAKSHELGKLKSITSIGATVTSNQKDIANQLQTEAYTSRVVYQFLHTIPSGASIDSYTMQMLTLTDLTAQPGAGGVNANNPCSSAPNPFESHRMIGCIRFQGTAKSYDQALRMNNYIEGTYLAQTYIGDITAAQTGWTFTGSVAIRPHALSGRYDQGQELKKGLIDGTIPAPPPSASPTPAAGSAG